MTIHFNENEKIHNRVTQFDTLGRLETLKQTAREKIEAVGLLRPQ